MEKTLIYQMYAHYTDPRDLYVGNEYHPELCYGLYGMCDDVKRVANLGTDIIWVSGILQSPRFDHGYDVSDFYRIETVFGSDQELRDLCTLAHREGMKVIIDLVLNHASTENYWFWGKHPEWFITTDKPWGDYRNLFDGQSAWAYDKRLRKYYLHLFHEKQADFRWFLEDGSINQELVQEFRSIVKYWQLYGHVDGFRLDVPQSINKDLTAETLDLGALCSGTKAIEVINAIFDGIDTYLLMESLDPTNGQIGKMYLDQTPVDRVLNIFVKDNPVEDLDEAIRKSAIVPGFALDLESHDSCRFLSRPGATLEKELDLLFAPWVNTVCLFQGQELGLKNPVMEDKDYLELDAQTAMKVASGMNLEDLKATSRANNRVLLPSDEFKAQMANPDSVYHKFKNRILKWKK